jgi:hypothetical protein
LAHTQVWPALRYFDAIAMVYFALMASSELSGHGWVKQKGGAPPAA